MQQEPSPEPIGLREPTYTSVTQQELDDLYTELQKLNMWMEQWKFRALRAEEVLDRVTNDRKTKWHNLLNEAIIRSTDDGILNTEDLITHTVQLFVEEHTQDIIRNS